MIILLIIVDTYCNLSTVTGARGGPYNFKKMHRDPDPTKLTGKLTKLLTWSYVKILLIVPNYRFYGMDVPVSILRKRKAQCFVTST